MGGENSKNPPKSSTKPKNKIIKGNDKQKEKKLSNNEGSIDKVINNINNINENEIKNEEKKIDKKEVILETLIRIFCFEEEFKQLYSDKNSGNNDFEGIIIPKKIIENYKKMYSFGYLKKKF